MTGIKCRKIELLEALFKEIKYFEMDRAHNDLLNLNRCKALYDLYFKLLEEVERYV